MNYAPEFAGVGRYSGDIAEYLASTGSDVVVVTTPAHYPGWQVDLPFVNGRYTAERRKGVSIIRCPLILRKRMEGLWRLVAPLSFALTAAPVMLWQMMRHRFDVVVLVVPTLFGAPVVLLGAALTGARTVVHMQDLEVDAAFAVGHLAQWKWLKRIGALFERFVLRRFHQIATISDRMAERIAHKGIPQDKIAVVRNWVDLDHIRPHRDLSAYREQLGIRPTDFVVHYCGNVGRKQGLAVLLDAAVRLAGCDDVKFVIAGEGPAKSELVARYGHLRNVRFLPFQPHDRFSEFLGLADLHALPQEEGTADLVLPSKLGGMLASGKPIVVMTGPDTELGDFLRDTAMLVPPGDSASLAEAIRGASMRRSEDAAAVAERLRLAETLSKREGLPRLTTVVLGAVRRADNLPRRGRNDLGRDITPPKVLRR